MNKLLLAVLLAAPASAADAPKAAAKTEAKKAPAAEGYEPMDWKVLSNYKFEVPEPVINDNPTRKPKPPKLKDKIPDDIMALDGKKVVLKGFMVPIDEDATGVRKFALMRNPMGCCFAGSVNINEYATVEMAPGKKARFMPYVPVTVEGVLFVGVMIEEGFVAGLYRMQGDSVK
jgi:hypothetical protein